MIKSKFDTEQLSIRLGYLFSGLGISPNTWTLLAIIPAVLGFLALFYHKLLLGLLLFLVSGMIDAIDGAVARVTNSVSNLGAFLDGIIDRYVEIMLYFGLMFYLWGAYYFLPLPFWILLLVFGALMPTFVRAYAHHRNVVTEPEDQRRMGGLIERFERLTLIFVGMFLGTYSVSFLIYVVVVVAILSNITALQRILFVARFK